LTLLLLPACLRYLERLWGAVETLKFVTLTLTFSNLLALASSWLEWVITGNKLFMYVAVLRSPFLLAPHMHARTPKEKKQSLNIRLLSSYHMNYHGQTALQTGVLVAFTQLIPEHQVQFFGVFSVRVKVKICSSVPSHTSPSLHACLTLPFPFPTRVSSDGDPISPLAIIY
jgi:Eukaryotic integral membrane protein (DUF1751)